MALLWCNSAGYYRYLDLSGTPTRVRNRSPRTESNRNQSLATRIKAPRHSHGGTHARADRFTNHLRLQGSNLGIGSAAASSEIARPCLTRKHWAACRWRRQPLITRGERVGTAKELYAETRTEHSPHLMDECTRLHC